MPALRPCLRCGALTRRAGGYCIECQPPYSPRKQRSGGRQQTFRKRTLERFGYACVNCGSYGSPENPIEAAHDIALDTSESWRATYEQAESGIPLCRKCHREIDAAMRRARRGRMG